MQPRCENSRRIDKRKNCFGVPIYPLSGKQSITRHFYLFRGRQPIAKGVMANLSTEIIESPSAHTRSQPRKWRPELSAARSADGDTNAVFTLDAYRLSPRVQMYFRLAETANRTLEARKLTDKHRKWSFDNLLFFSHPS
jgi:hypothetical protein